MDRYDVAIIGCGMSGLAAGIRLAHFGQRVCIFERHNAPGGLNGFFARGGRRFDVGLHALTNWVPEGVKGTPLARILRQLRIDRAELDLCVQRRSRVAFPGVGLEFTNDPALLEAAVAAAYPARVDGYRRLVEAVRATDTDAPGLGEESARARLRELLAEPVLEDLLLCPLMFYGSATEHDLPWWSFAVLFRSIYLEGFCRPLEGVRVILRVLLAKYRQAGGERRMKCGVARLVAGGRRVVRLELDDGREVEAGRVLSTIGWPETVRLLGPGPWGEVAGGGLQEPERGRLSFVECQWCLDREPAALGWGEDTIVFYNDAERFTYAAPVEAAVDDRSGVVCVPNNYRYGEGRALPEGVVRFTAMAQPAAWRAMDEPTYRAAKVAWMERVSARARRFLPPVDDAVLARAIVETDMFTPRTIERYTGRMGGAVYGCPSKVRDGRTPLENLFLAGTDQGYLGIVGSLVSGIGMANVHLLRGA